MKKKIAVFANGWSYQYLREAMEGIRECALDHNVDIFVFMSFVSWSDSDLIKHGELNVYKLPDLSDFDGAILVANTFNTDEEKNFVWNKVKDSGIPAIALEHEVPGMEFVGADNYTGMYELAEHLITEHKVKDILIIGGLEDHLESIERIRAVVEAAKAHETQIPEENIVYGKWYTVEAGRVLAAWVEQHGRIPEAIVCVNDDMAMGVSHWLELNGYSVPQDVLLTGFDNVISGLGCFPSLTTVEKQAKEEGAKALELLLDKIQGKEILPKILFPSKLRMGETCGCQLDAAHSRKRAEISRKVFGNLNGDIAVDGHYRELIKIAGTARDLPWFRKCMNGYWEIERIFDTEECFLLANQDYFKIDIPEEEITREGYGPQLDVVCGMHRGKVSSTTVIDRRQLLPDYEPDSPECDMYVFVSVFTEERSIGYVVVANDLNIFANYEIYTWTRNMKENFAQVRQNLKLEELNQQLKKLSLTDALTGLYNRLGCEELVAPYLQMHQKVRSKCLLLITDINKMKLINDQYGHLQGDMAVKTVATALNEVFGESGITVRFGGDEFLAVGECEDEEQAEKLIAEISTILQRLVRESELPFALTVSNGYTMIGLNEEISLDRFIRRADMAMYSDKGRSE